MLITFQEETNLNLDHRMVSGYILLPNKVGFVSLVYLQKSNTKWPDSTMASIFGKKNNSHRQSFLGLGGGGINNAPTVPHPLHVMATKTVTVPLCSLTTLGEKQVSEASHNQAQALSHRANHLNSHPARCQETQQTQTSLSWDCISPWPALSVGFGLHKTSKKSYHEIYNRKTKIPCSQKHRMHFIIFKRFWFILPSPQTNTPQCSPTGTSLVWFCFQTCSWGSSDHPKQWPKILPGQQAPAWAAGLLDTQPTPGQMHPSQLSPLHSPLPSVSGTRQLWPEEK